MIAVFGVVVDLDRNLLLDCMGSSRSHQGVQAFCSTHEGFSLVLQIATLTLYLALG